MLKKLFLASALALGLAIPFVATSTAQAAPRGHVVHRQATPRGHVAYRHHSRYQVQYRRCGTNAWCASGTFASRRSAQVTVARLRHRGFEVRLVGC